MHSTVEALMAAEVAINGGTWGERAPGRTNRRNGYRGRRWDTRVGTIDLKIPGCARARTSQPDCSRRAGRASARC